jgi:glycosyltransferase involved in cell wall biosynthesis
LNFSLMKKDRDALNTAPGTGSRNYGIKCATGDYVCFADDDDRYSDLWLERLLTGCSENSIGVVQMNIAEHKINGRQTGQFRLIPEADLKMFPVPCHVGTPCFAVPRTWALDNPWQSEPDHLHDFHFIQRICERYHPSVHIAPGWSVDVDGCQVGQLRDWVSKPPYYRN